MNKDQKAEVAHANWEITEKDKKHKAKENALENTITKWRMLFGIMSIVSFWLYGIAAHAMGWWAPVEWLIAISVIGIILFGLYNIAQDNPISTMFGLGGFGFLSLVVWLIFR